MGELIEGNFPRHNQADDESEDLINPQHLVGPIGRVDELIFGRKSSADLSIPEIYDVDRRGAHASYGYKCIRLHAPLDWVQDISDESLDSMGREMAGISQAYLLTVLYAKKKLDNLDNNKERHKKLLNLSPQTHFRVGDEELELDYHNARDIQLWQAAAAISLRAVTAQGSKQRTLLKNFLNSLKAEELQIELEDQGFSPHKSRLKKLFKKKQIYELDGYKVGCLTPMSSERLAKISPQFFRAASN